MEQSPSWEPNSPSPCQGTAWILQNPEVHTLVHNSPPLVPILSQTNPVHTTPTTLLKTQCSIILPSTSSSSKLSLSLRFPHQTSVEAVPLLLYMPSHRDNETLYLTFIMDIHALSNSIPDTDIIQRILQIWAPDLVLSHKHVQNPSVEMSDGKQSCQHVQSPFWLTIQ
jgi:hypothetical protein